MKIPVPFFFPACAVIAVFSLGTSEAGSLWIKEGSTEQSMFADKIARNIGDILTVVVQEDTLTKQGAKIKTYSDASAGVGVALNNLLTQFFQAAPKWFGSATGVPVNDDDVDIPTIELAGKWNGGGDSENSMSITNRTAVTVIDVLPNGNLVIEGAKIIRSGKESQYAYMRGIVRPVDITSGNTILSTQIADAQVEFIPEGELTDAEKKGWLLRAWDKIKPI
jgi:flagellar L-ring protein precursor FlgH